MAAGADIPLIYIVSGGVGASGEQLVQTVLAQFPDHDVKVIRVTHVRQIEQITEVVEQARINDGILVHTLVDSKLRSGLLELARQAGVAAIDLMGPLIERLTITLGRSPVEHPGLYRQLNQAYYERVSAIDFAMAHDDGKNSQDWGQADVLILGVSRSGKTPISFYLSVLGWKVANYPVVTGLDLPAELFTLDQSRVVGLLIDPGQLVMHREARQSRLGVRGPSAYTDPQAVYEEIEAVRQLYNRNGFLKLDVTDKPIESCADEIIRLVKLGKGAEFHG